MALPPPTDACRAEELANGPGVDCDYPPDELFKAASRGASDDQARRALAELALIAPDDERLADMLRERSGSARPKPR